MPRGDHFRKVEDTQILRVFEEFDGDQKLLAADDISMRLNRDVLDDEEITAEAIRQRMRKVDGVERVKLGRDVFWKKKGADVVLGQTPAGAAYYGSLSLGEKVFTARFWWSGIQIFAANLLLIGAFVLGGSWLAVNGTVFLGVGFVVLGIIGVLLEYAVLTEGETEPGRFLEQMGTATQVAVESVARRLV